MKKTTVLWMMIIALLLTGLCGCGNKPEELGVVDEMVEGGSQQKEEQKEPEEQNVSEEQKAPEEQKEPEEQPTANGEFGEYTGGPISFEGLPVYESGISQEYVSYVHLSDFKEKYTLDNRIVIRGKKDGLSVPAKKYREDGSFSRHYCETPIRVLEVYYGDVQPGDLLIHNEMITIGTQGEKICLFVDSNAAPIEEDEEYIFIFNVLENSKNEPRYGGISVHHSYHKIADYELYKQKVADGTATYRENFGFEVMDYYLHQPETKLDLHLEASKYVKDLPKDATQQEILEALPTKELRELFERMIEQYGVQSDKTVVEQQPVVS